MCIETKALFLIIYIWVLGVLGNNDNLITVVQIFRHGQRTPFQFTPNDQYSNLSQWKTKPGQLVNEGKVEQYNLGKFTRKRYDGFLPSIYNSRDIFVVTTDEDRTHMSAQCNLAGLYPPTSSDVWNKNLLWQPIPIHIAEKNIIWFECDALYQLLQNELISSVSIQHLNQKFSYIYDYLSKHTGTKIKTMFSVYRVYDTMFVESLSKLKLPSWSKAVFPEPLRTISAHALEAHCHFVLLKKVCVGRLLKEILDHFNLMLADPTRSHKLKMYSSHDKNVACVLNALGAFIPHIPSFASSIYIELRKNKDQGYVNVWYKNDFNFQAITVKGCSFNCTFANFKRLVGKYAVEADEYNRICTINKKDIRNNQLDESEVWGSHTHIPPYK